jgi:hypothetical protein
MRQQFAERRADSFGDADAGALGNAESNAVTNGESLGHGHTFDRDQIRRHGAHAGLSSALAKDVD